MKTKIAGLLIVVLFSMNVEAKTLFREADYQKAWCFLNNGIIEYVNSDNTRVDCLTDTHAIEFDFAGKWAEGVGQAQYYSLLTGKRGKVVLIIENQKDFKYLKRAQCLAKYHDFDVDYVTPEIFSYGFNKK